MEPTHPDTTADRTMTAHPWRAFALLVIAYFMTIVDLTIVNVSLPTIGRELDFTESSLQWVVTAYGLTFGGFLLLGGRASDLLGRRRLLMIGLVIFSVASLACGLATQATFLIVMRGVQGLGAAIVLPAALASVMAIFPEGSSRNQALGIWGAAGALGATAGLLAGGLFTSYIGWPAIFYFNVPIGLAALVLAPRLVPETRERAQRRSYDVLGAVSGTAAVTLLVYAISRAPQVGWDSSQTLWLLAVAVALVVAFVLIEGRVAAPLLPGRLFRSGTVLGANVVGFLLTGSFYTYIFVGTLYLQQILGFSPLRTGFAWLLASVTSVAFAGLSQALVTRFSPKAVMAFGMTLIGAGPLWATQIQAHGSFWADLAGPIFLAGVGTAFGFIPVSIGALTGIQKSDAGIASGLLSTFQQLGGAMGVAVASSVAASRTGSLLSLGYAPAEALTGGFQAALWVCGLTGLAGVPITFLLIRRTPTDTALAPTGGRPDAVVTGD